MLYTKLLHNKIQVIKKSFWNRIKFIWLRMKWLKYKMMLTLLNRPFPNCLVPLFQSEPWCKTFHMKMSFICMWMETQVVFYWDQPFLVGWVGWVFSCSIWKNRFRLVCLINFFNQLWAWLKRLKTMGSVRWHASKHRFSRIASLFLRVITCKLLATNAFLLSRNFFF